MQNKNEVAYSLNLSEKEILVLCNLRKINTVKWVGQKGDRKIVVYGVQ